MFARSTIFEAVSMVTVFDKMDNQDLNGIRTFNEVVRGGSFAAAARRMGVPRSTVSLRIRALEAALGIRLFKRSTRAIALTSDGQELFNGTHEPVERILATMAAMGATKGELRGQIRFTAPADFPTDILASAIGTFRSQHPQVDFDIILDNDVLDLVADNIDIALRIGLSNRQDTVARRAVAVRFVFVASPVYLERHGEPKQIEDIVSLIVPQRKFREHLERYVIGQPLSVAAIQTNHFGMIRELAIGGFGIGLLPIRLCESDIAAGTLRFTLPHLIAGAMTMHLSFPSRADMSDRVKAFADHLLGFFSR
jgi:DNA-binding transcriptional LysR family regulator